MKFTDFGESVAEKLRSGRVVRLTGPAAAETATANEAFSTLGIAAALAVPWLERGKLKAVLFLHSQSPRIWLDVDVSTIEKVLERTMGWIERERALDREKVMIREIDHRARNLLAVVQAIVRLMRAENVGSFREKLLDRISALSRTHSLLAQRRWSPVRLETLVEQELAPYIEKNSTRISMSGPNLTMEPELAQSVAMALHELATNAAKHGAFSKLEGQLSITWQETEEETFRFIWRETLTDGRKPASSPGAGGFGTSLLTRVIEDQLKGTIKQDFTTTGLHCEINFPLTHPVVRTSPPEAGESSATAGDIGIATANGVLIVEDEATIAMDLIDTVQSLGYEVFATASNVKRGLAAIQTTSPWLALLDANLSGENAEPIAQILSKRGVPFIVISGYSSVTPHDGALAAAPRLSKPFTGSDLAEMIKVLAETKELETPRSA